MNLAARKCAKCLSELPSDASFCSSCGTSIPEPTRAGALNNSPLWVYRSTRLAKQAFRWLRDVVLGYLCFVLLSKFAGFTAIQSLLLTIMIATLVFNARWLGRKPFEPFSIHIKPRWYFLLTEQGVIDDDLWDEVQDKLRSAKPKRYRLLRDGISLTAIKPELYYSHNHHYFSSSLDVYEPIKELPARGQLGFAARFYMREHLTEHPRYGLIRCIEFGLVTEKSLGRSYHASDDRDHIPVATLPDAAFNGYYAGENFTLNKRLSDREIDALLTEFGWAGDSHGLRHKYVEVLHHAI